MKRVLFLMLFLMILGIASVRAQVRIGGDMAPNAAAVLDLNADDSATPAGNRGALALPRISLASITAQLNGAAPLKGMLVYNTNASLTDGEGVYYWDGGKWTIVGKVYTGSTSVTLSGNSFQRAALTGDVTAAANSNATTIANNAVTATKIANNNVTMAKLARVSFAESKALGASAGSSVSFNAPAGCNITNSIVNVYDQTGAGLNWAWAANSVVWAWRDHIAVAGTVSVYWLCITN